MGKTYKDNKYSDYSKRKPNKNKRKPKSDWDSLEEYYKQN